MWQAHSKIYGVGFITLVAATFACSPSIGQDKAFGCQPPIPPLALGDASDIRLYGDLIRMDFETYLREAEAYFLCSDRKRTQVFEEARRVTQDYAVFLEKQGD